jgi:16S rRNA (cytidine1402-2'-O)-methyltransferase
VTALYIVATPIGNLEDISLRALRILKQVKLIAAEDTRTTGHLLSHYDIKTPLTSYYEHNKKQKLNYLLERLTEGDVALVSDAGMPGLSDTGYELISEAIKRNIQVIPVPGASAAIAALVVSGLPPDQFIYIGFIPRKKGERIAIFKSLADEPQTLVTYESPHRLLATLQDMLEVFGDRRIAVCRELTKLHEEVFRGTLSEAINHFTVVRGEFTLVVAGKAEEDAVMTEDIEKAIRRLQNEGTSARNGVARIAGETGLPKKKVYQTWINIQKGDKTCDEDA